MIAFQQHNIANRQDNIYFQHVNMAHEQDRVCISVTEIKDHAKNFPNASVFNVDFV